LQIAGIAGHSRVRLELANQRNDKLQISTVRRHNESAEIQYPTLVLKILGHTGTLENCNM
jgi:hypothetical protein